MRIPLSCVCGLVYLVTAHAAETHFRVSNADGLQAAISRLAVLRSGGNESPATIELAGNTYWLDQTIKFGPKIVGKGLTIRATADGKAILSGGMPLIANHLGDDGRWRYSLPDNWKSTADFPRTIIVDGKLVTAARIPKQGYFRIEQSLPDRRSGFVTKAKDLLPSIEIGPDVACDLVFLHDWSSSRMPIASYDHATRVLKTIGPIGNQAAHYAIDHFEKHPRYWLEGHPAFATDVGDWYVDHGSEEIVLLGNPKPDTPAPTVVLPWIETIIEASGRGASFLENLTIAGIQFSATRFPMPPGGLAASQASFHERRQSDGGRSRKREILSSAVSISQANNAVVKDCSFVAIGNSGLSIGARTRNCRVEGCRFDFIGGNAINMGDDRSGDDVPKNNKVLSNSIEYCGQILPGSVAIWAALHDSLEIAHNTIRHCPYTGISLGWRWNASPTAAKNNHIHDNRIESIMEVLSDGGGIYTLGWQQGTLIENNTIVGVTEAAGRAESNGMFFDQGTTGIKITGNTIRGVKNSPLRFHQCGPNYVIGNRWELADGVPPLRFNNTPEANIVAEGNEVLTAE